MYQFSITLQGKQHFTEEEVMHLINNNILDAVTCIRSTDGSVLINSPARVVLTKIGESTEAVTHLIQSII